MNKDSFIKQATEQLNKINVPYRVQDSTDIAISGTFKKKEDEDESAAILYAAFIFFNPDDNTVYAYERAMSNGVDISKDPSYSGVVVKKGDNSGNDESLLPIGTILTTIASIAVSFGAAFRRTDNEQLAKYPNISIPPISSTNASASAFCTNCGAKMPAGTRFCTSCGTDSKSPPVAQAKPFVSNDAPPVYVNANITQRPNPANINPGVQPIKPRRKVPVAIIAIVSVLIIGVLVTGGILIRNWIQNKKPNDNTNINPTASSAPGLNIGSQEGSSVVSEGVTQYDLGNIMNGQYYFATKDCIFYSSFDENYKAHIYRMDKDGRNFQSIFNGFGWSLVVIEDWLYFSGNQGDTIDGTYNIFRMKLDGSSVERINNTYSYGMFLYDEYLYYMKRNTDYTSTYSVCRSLLDGTGEEVLAQYGYNPVIYDDLLYYYDNQGNMFRCKPDGTDPQVLLTAEVGFYVLSDEKIIYKDFSSSIYMCDLNGENKKLVKTVQDMDINTVNVYNNRIYFVQYNQDNYNYTTYSWPYDLVSIKTDGSDEKVIFSSSSYGMYLNIVSGRLMLMDYKYDTQTGLMYTDINSMNIDGSDLRLLTR